MTHTKNFDEIILEYMKNREFENKSVEILKMVGTVETWMADDMCRVYRNEVCMWGCAASEIR